MALFEDEKWEVVAQMEENVFHGEDISHVGYLIRSTRADGSTVDIVDGYGIGRGEADRDAAVLFAASKDLFNSAEIVAPLLSLLRGHVAMDPERERAISALEAAIAYVNENLTDRNPGPTP